MTEVEIKLDRYARVYFPGETVSGVVLVKSSSKLTHQGVKLNVEGKVSLQLSARSVGLFEAFYSSIEPLELLKYNIPIRSAGRLPRGTTELPFEFDLKPRRNMKIHETYHGVYVSVQYIITTEIKRGAFSNNIKKTMEFIVKTKSKAISPEKVSFKITPDNLKNVRAPKKPTANANNASGNGNGKTGNAANKNKKTTAGNGNNGASGKKKTAASAKPSASATAKPNTVAKNSSNSNSASAKGKDATAIGDFLITGYFEGGVCNVEQPFRGEIIVEKCEQDIRSVELQFVRVETCIYAETEIREATEIQNIQLADGNICRNLTIPIYMIFPRLFTCATTMATQFKVEYEVNVVVLFKDNHMITENFPLKLVRIASTNNF